MTVALITDQHLDGRKGSIQFWEFFQKFYDNVFFPSLEKYKIKTVIDLGDTFDNRKTIDYNVWSRIRKNYFDRLSEMGIQVHMIVGNHCVYYKNTNEINSPELLLEDYDNITVYTEPTEVEIEGEKILMLPWINTENHDKTMAMIDQTKAHIAMGHLELNGFEVTPGMIHEGGMEPDVFFKFRQVFSGHFHHKSSIGNITYLGNPYQMFWNDYKEVRGFHMYEPKKNTLGFVKNPYEIFKKIYYDDTKPMDIDVDAFKNTYVKLVVEEKTDFHQFDKLVDDLHNAPVLDLKIIETLVEDDTKDVDINLEVTDTLSLLNEYIDEVEMKVSKTELKSIMRTLYIESCETV